MRKKIYILIITFIVIIGVAGISFAYLKTNTEGNYNSITLSDFHVDLVTDISNVTMNNTYPMSDVEGLSQTGNKVTFAIKNNGEILANYKVSLVDKETVSTLLNKDVRYRLKRTIGTGAEETFPITNLDDNGLLDEGTIESGVTITYELIMWQDYNSTANGVTFKKSILVEGMQSSNLDKSGANFPELLDNMIAVYYDKQTDTTGVWRKADSKNLNGTYKWFDYNEQMWANAVTVKENGTKTRDYYLNADVGSEISMDDITTMWVWIPRYKYVIFNGNNETSEEQEIKVIFEHGKDKTGTVRCHDDILTSDDSNHSEICTDTTNGSIINYKSTYTHPAFTFGDEELTGFWISKFEMSTDDQTCNETGTVENCNKTGLNILVKPDKTSLMNESLSNMFVNIRRMETYGNIHGFEQSSSATTWLDNNSNLTGEIANDSNNFDTHMIKNMEWGAVAYLSQSKYGKYGNSLYEGIYKNIYVNNYSSRKTGYSSGVPDISSESDNAYAYNVLMSDGYGQGYLGAGASTTGNTYGVYDTVGGLLDRVMVYCSVSDGNLNFSTPYIPLNKYYDIYLCSTNSDKTKGKLGDATKEVIKSNSDAWNGGFGNFLSENNFMERGGILHIYESIFTFYVGVNESHVNSSSRPVLTVSRDMPWLDE